MCHVVCGTHCAFARSVPMTPRHFSPLRHDTGVFPSNSLASPGSVSETDRDPRLPPSPGILPRQTRSQVQIHCPLPHSQHFSGVSFCTLYASPAFVMIFLCTFSLPRPTSAPLTDHAFSSAEILANANSVLHVRGEPWIFCGTWLRRTLLYATLLPRFHW